MCVDTGACGKARPRTGDPPGTGGVLWPLRRGLPDRRDRGGEDAGGFEHRGRTRSRSVGSAPFDGSASTTCRFSAGVICSASWTRTPSTTTRPGRTGASTFVRPMPRPDSREPPRCEFTDGTSSADSSTSTRESRHDWTADFGARQGQRICPASRRSNPNTQGRQFGQDAVDPERGWDSSTIGLPLLDD